MKSLALVVLMLTALNVSADGILGIYSTNPEVHPGLQINTDEEKRKKFIEKFTIKLQVTDSTLILLFENEHEVNLIYTKEGQYLLAKQLDEDDLYLPFYIDNNGNIHGFSTVFFKVQ